MKRARRVHCRHEMWDCALKLKVHYLSIRSFLPPIRGSCIASHPLYGIHDCIQTTVCKIILSHCLFPNSQQLYCHNEPRAFSTHGRRS